MSKNVPPNEQESKVPAEFREVATLCAAGEVLIGGRTVIGIDDARKLHSGLGVGRDFTTWIDGRIRKYGFRQGVDYEVSQSPNLGIGDNLHTGGKPAKTYRLTLHMAKELAMVENNDRGRLIRRYYIWLEEVAAAGLVDPEVIRRIDGISRMLSHKVAGTEKMVKLVAESVERQDQRIEKVETAVIMLAQAVKDLMMIADNRGAATVEFVSVRMLLDEAGALPKGRNSINRRIGNALRNLALTKQPPIPLRKCLHSGVWLYPIDFAKAFMRDAGDAWVSEHNSRVKGQGVLPFLSRRRKPTDDPQPTA